MSILKLARRGALARACELISQGYEYRPLINKLHLEFPSAHKDELAAIYAYATQACAAARSFKYVNKKKHLSKKKIPHLPDR